MEKSASVTWTWSTFLGGDHRWRAMSGGGKDLTVI
jgi:hypothetical protein